jgi:hypothetical protein
MSQSGLLLNLEMSSAEEEEEDYLESTFDGKWRVSGVYFN